MAQLHPADKLSMEPTRNQRLVACFLMFLPALAWANAGTPLVFASAIHLMMGNAVIGIGEGLLLAFLIGGSYIRCMAWMILANYVSAWVGYMLLGPAIAVFLQDSLTLANVWPWYLRCIACAWLLTLLLEWPFVYLACRTKATAKRFAVLISLLLQTLSYAIIVPWYMGASQKSLWQENEIVSVAELPLPQGLHLYYLSPKGESVYRYAADTATTELVQQAPASQPFTHISLYHDGEDTETLKQNLSEDSEGEAFHVAMLKIPPDWQAQVSTYFWGPSPSEKVTFRDSHGDIIKNAWRFELNIWAWGGITAFHIGSRPTRRIGLEIPGLAWQCRNASHLPGDLALFQFGPTLICLWDPETQRVAQVARGTFPVAALAPPAAAVTPAQRP